MNVADAESQPEPELFLSSWCHSLNSRLPPKAGSRGEKSVAAQGSCCRAALWIFPECSASDRKTKERRQKTRLLGKKKYTEKKSPEWHQCMGRAAETWTGQTVWRKESAGGRGGGGVKAKVSAACLVKFMRLSLWCWHDANIHASLVCLQWLYYVWFFKKSIKRSNRSFLVSRVS